MIVVFLGAWSRELRNAVQVARQPGADGHYPKERGGLVQTRTERESNQVSVLNIGQRMFSETCEIGTLSFGDSLKASKEYRL
jgi:hypothetical protein